MRGRGTSRPDSSRKATRPLSGVSSPRRTRARVVFPPPFGPTIAVRFPAGIVKEAEETAVRPLKETVTSSKRTATLTPSLRARREGRGGRRRR